jgi:hypothetical protein
MGFHLMRDQRRGLGREYVGGRLADAEFADEREEKAREQAKKLT